MERGPDFIGLGAMRAGSTWLYQTLARHPRIWMAPIKELHYFDNGSRSRWYRHLRHRVLKARTLTAWDLRYFLRPRSDAWYATLFREGRRRGLVTGEVTPAYALLSDDHFKRMLALNPRMRFIYQMRDPLDRAWSAYLKEVKNGRCRMPADDVFDPEAVRFVMRHSNYMQVIERLDRLVPPGQVHLGFFDTMAADPKEFTTEVLSFLGVDADIAAHLLPRGRVNAVAEGRPFTPGFARVAAPMAIEQLEPLCRRLNGPPAVWLDRAKSLLERSPVAA